MNLKKTSIMTIFLAISAIFLSALSIGCKKESTAKKTKAENTNLPPSLRDLNEESAEYIKGKNIVVVLGYGFNDSETVEKIKAELNSSVSVETESSEGLASIFVFPDNFMSGKNGKITKLPSLIEEKNIIGMIIFGAPEKTHKTLTDLMDKEESGILPYPVISFFSQDDPLGTEYTSDIAIDYAGNTAGSEELDAEKTYVIPDFDASSVIANTIKVMLRNKKPFDKNDKLQDIVKEILGDKHKVSRYIDLETKIPAINHFTFE